MRPSRPRVRPQARPPSHPSGLARSIHVSRHHRHRMLHPDAPLHPRDPAMAAPHPQQLPADPRPSTARQGPQQPRTMSRRFPPTHSIAPIIPGIVDAHCRSAIPHLPSRHDTAHMTPPPIGKILNLRASSSHKEQPKHTIHFIGHLVATAGLRLHVCSANARIQTHTSTASHADSAHTCIHKFIPLSGDYRHGTGPLLLSEKFWLPPPAVFRRHTISQVSARTQSPAPPPLARSQSPRFQHAPPY
jgi:hypothetical protein